MSANLLLNLPLRGEVEMLEQSESISGGGICADVALPPTRLATLADLPALGEVKVSAIS
jgi:hypothetical protein